MLLTLDLLPVALAEWALSYGADQDFHPQRRLLEGTASTSNFEFEVVLALRAIAPPAASLRDAQNDTRSRQAAMPRSTTTGPTAVTPTAVRLRRRWLGRP